MSRIKSDKKIPELEPYFESILFCNEKKLRPFIEIFICEPENVAQQKLGTLLGIFEISDFSEDSSYISNYLISVIKKEYFSKLKRGSIESFEAALHKANLALSKLAEHGSIGWIGKFNAIIASIEKNNIHLSQAGTVSALLLRSTTLTDISEGLAPEEGELTPLKTFVNVTSGRLEEEDKVIIATENIFNIFSFDEIKKSALNFSKEEFGRFLRTALSNELDKSAVLIVDIGKKMELPEPIRKNGPINVFSQEAFSKSSSLAKRKTLEEEFEESIQKEVLEEKSKEKNGHLYIKEAEVPLLEQPSKSNEIWIDMEEKAGRMMHRLKISFKNLIFSIWDLISKIKFIPWKKIFFAIWSAIKYVLISAKTFLLIISKKIAGFFIKNPEEKTEPATIPENIESKRIDELFLQKPQLLAIEEKKFSILPNFNHLKNALSSMSYEKKIYAILIILAIIIIPYFIVKVERNIQEKKVEELAIQQQEITPEIVIPLADDNNVFRIENLIENYSGENISKIINLNDKIFAVSASEIISLETNEKFPIPQELGSADISCPMDDLNLILLINKQTKKIQSWSPASKKFQVNNIVVTENAEISDAQTYLTYIYLIDSKNNQIYRYPRAEGGFGEKVDWKKDTTNISTANSVAINENLFLANGKDIFKFYRGKKQDFSIETTATSIAPLKLWTKRDNVNLYALDKENSRIVKLDPNGAIISQFYNPEITSAIDFTVNESINNIFFTTSEKIQSFQMN